MKEYLASLVKQTTSLLEGALEANLLVHMVVNRPQCPYMSEYLSYASMDYHGSKSTAPLCPWCNHGKTARDLITIFK